MEGVRDRVLQAIDPEAIARDCLAFVEVASPTGEEGPGAEFLARLLEQAGLDVKWLEVEPRRPNVSARIAGGGGGAALALNGHVDTIPWGDCVAAGRDGDWIYGRGAEDMKGGLVAMVHAARALRAAGARLRGDLWLTGVMGHESPIGKKEGPRALIRQLRSGEVSANAILIVEGPAEIWCASLGSTIFTIRIESDRGPIHTIKVPYRENPIRWVGRLLAELEHLEGDFERREAHPLAGRHQLNLGQVHVGDYYNRLPQAGMLQGTRRWPPGTTAEAVRAELERILAQLGRDSGLRFGLEMTNAREPFETKPDHPLIGALQAAGRTALGRTPQLIGMGLVGDANFYANEGGVPTVYFGPAHETAHSDTERVSIRRLAELAGLYALTAMQFCGVAE